MNEEKKKLYQEEAKKSKGGFKTSFYYVDTTKAESLGISEYRTKKDDNFIRIITPDIEKFWGLEVWKHTNIGANRATFLCVHKMFGEPCPICDRIAQLRAKDPADPNIKALYPTKRFLLYVYDVTNETTEAEGLKWFDCPSVVKDNIMSLAEDKRKGVWVEVEDPKDGRDIEFSRIGTGLGTKYSGFKLVATDPIPAEWYSDVPDFLDILLIPDPEVMKEEVMGVASTESPSSAGKAPVREHRRAAVEEPVEETEDVEYATDENGEEVEIEETPPAPAPATRRSRTVTLAAAPAKEVETEKVSKTPSPASATAAGSSADDKREALKKKIEAMKQKRSAS